MNLKEALERQKAAKKLEAGSGESIGGAKHPQHKQSNAGSNPAPATKPTIKKPAIKLASKPKSGAATKESESALPSPDTADTEKPEPQKANPREMMPGEVPASSANESQPGDMDAKMQAFKALVDKVPTLFDDADLMGQALRKIMSDLQTNPEFFEMLVDENIHNMVRGFKDTMGAAQIKAQAKKKPSSRSKPSKLDANDLGELDNMLAQMGFQ